MSVTAMKAKNAVESLREIVQDLVVPDLKAVKIEVESHRRETKIEFDSVRNEIRTLADSLRTEMRLRDEKQSLAIEALSDKIGYTTDIRERLAILEDRGKRAS
jgi:hypothetical protein